MIAGMELAAIRDGKRIGTVQVTSADNLGSYGQRVSGAVLRPGDQLRGIYQLPSGRKARDPERAYRKKTRFEKVVIGAAALLGIADLGATARLLAQGSFAVPGLAVSNLANVREVAMSQEAATQWELWGGSLITWSPLDEPTAESRLLGFEIWRAGGPNQGGSIIWVVSSGTLGQNYVFDLPWIPALYYGWGSFAIDPITGLATYDPITGISVIDPDNPPPVVAIDATLTTLDYTSFWLIGPTPGVTYQYRVRPIISERYRLTPAVYRWRINHDTEFSTAQLQVTTVGVPRVGNIPPEFDPAQLAYTFYFYSPPGGDEGILQIARDPNNYFPPGSTYTQTITGLPGATAVWPNWPSYNFNPVRRADMEALPGNGNIYWWRVGVRNRSDTILPRPWPDDVSDRGYVWSATERMELPASPSPPLVREQRERQRALIAGPALGRSRILRDRPAGDRRVRTQ